MRLLRLVKYLFLFVVALGLVLMAMANRDIVTLELIPAELAVWLGVDYTLDLPLFLVVLGGVVLGLMVGFVWEWIRETRHRTEARTQKRAAKQLEREVETLRGDQRKRDGGDDILALVDDSAARG
ncbi:MAG: lipopolysaccharide assembly protein LapA domain-containing protein [Rhodobacteraceae bacterium]|jgi:putative membrane protein|nr:lipopolysaccharide assembly protein LapA domain-containing protein [Paracoccaceae bacterium]